MGVIVSIFLLMLSFAAAFWYLFRTVSRLRTIEEMKDDFVSNMTHELKTPISIAYSANDALLNYDTSNDPEKKGAYLTIAMKQLKRLGELVENILAMSMERRKTMTLKPEKIDLPALADEIAEAQRMRGDKEIAIEVRSEGDISVTADKSHLSNVLNNLIDNSIKYSGESVAINIKLNADNIEVADNGIGIPAKSLPYIFDKFYRVPHGNRQDVRGYGIGLYYVKHILEKMGWSISVQCRGGKGQQGFDVVAAFDGIEGLAKYKTETADLIVADVMMPRLDGFAMAKEIRRISTSVPIIFLTAKSTIDDVEEGFDIGAHKPTVDFQWKRICHIQY